MGRNWFADPAQGSSSRPRELLRFVQDFYRVHGCVIANWNESDVELSLGVRLQAMCGPSHAPAGPARLFENIEAAADGYAVDENIEYAAAHSTPGRRPGTKPCLGKIEGDAVPPWRNGNGVAHITETLTAKQFRICHVFHGLGSRNQLPPVRVAVRLPNPSLLVNVEPVQREHANGTKLAPSARHDLDGAEQRRIAVRLEFQVQFSIGGRRNVLERSDVGGAGAGFADDVEFVERLFAVDPDIEHTAGFSAAGHIILAVERLREVEANFVDARRERNIVDEGTFAPALVDVGLAGAENRVTVGLEDRPTLKIPVALPNPAQAVRVISALAATFT